MIRIIEWNIYYCTIGREPIISYSSPGPERTLTFPPFVIILYWYLGWTVELPEKIFAVFTFGTLIGSIPFSAAIIGVVTISELKTIPIIPTIFY